MSKIKRFFAKKKEEVAFRLNIGGSQGRTLSAIETETSSSSVKVANTYNPPIRKELSDEARAAATAALARTEKKVNDLNPSLVSIKSQAKRELEAERNVYDISPLDKTTRINPSSNIAGQGVLFRCPFISDEILSKVEWKCKIKDFLYQQLEKDRALTSCLIIHNCNSKEKAEECIATLKKYLENILKFPKEEKYYKIRMSNRIFCEKVRYIEGALDFLHASGFREANLDNENVLYWSQENLETNYDLTTLLDALQKSEPIQLILDRNIKVMLPSQAKNDILPLDFYRISTEEIKREQQLKAEIIANAQILRTKAMRESEEQRAQKNYQYCLVKIKFPNGFFIQGTFSVYEKLEAIFEFVQSCLQNETQEFQLTASGNEKFTNEDMEKTLYELRLVPSSVFLFNATNGTSSSDAERNFLKEELLLLLQSAEI